MDLPEICKAVKCEQARVNDNFCGYHTHRLQPVYVRYKNLQASLTDLSTFSACQEQAKIPELVSMYNRLARAYKLRDLFRSTLKPEHRDSGHDHFIYLLSQQMEHIHQKLCTLTGKVQENAEPEPEPKLEEEDLCETPDLALEEVFVFEAERKKSSEYGAITRMDCVFAFEKDISLTQDILRTTVTRYLTRELPGLEHLMPGNGSTLKYSDPGLIDVLVNFALGASVQCMLAVNKRMDVIQSVSRGPAAVSVLMCCSKKAYGAILRDRKLLEFALELYSSKDIAGYFGVNIANTRVAIRYQPPNLGLEAYFPELKRPIQVPVNPLLASYFPNLKHTISGYQIPIALYEHVCDLPGVVCEICMEEMRQGLKYKTLSGHTVQIMEEKLQRMKEKGST